MARSTLPSAARGVRTATNLLWVLRDSLASMRLERHIYTAWSVIDAFFARTHAFLQSGSPRRYIAHNSRDWVHSH